MPIPGRMIHPERNSRPDLQIIPRNHIIHVKFRSKMLKAHRRGYPIHVNNQTLFQLSQITRNHQTVRLLKTIHQTPFLLPDEKRMYRFYSFHPTQLLIQLCFCPHFILLRRCNTDIPVIRSVQPFIGSHPLTFHHINPFIINMPCQISIRLMIYLHQHSRHIRTRPHINLPLQKHIFQLKKIHFLQRLTKIPVSHETLFHPSADIFRNNPLHKIKQSQMDRVTPLC